MDQPGSRIRPYALQEGEGWTYRFGVDFTVKAGEVQDGRGAAILEYITSKGEEPPDHTHGSEDEMFYVLEARSRFAVATRPLTSRRGALSLLPRGIEHGYTIRSEEPVRLIVVTSPVREELTGGWGGFVADMERGQGELIARPQYAG